MATAPTTWATVNVDGRLEVFMIGVNDAGDQGLWHIWQTLHGNGWTPWFSHGIPPGALVPGSCLSVRWSHRALCCQRRSSTRWIGFGGSTVSKTPNRTRQRLGELGPPSGWWPRSFRNAGRYKQFRWRAGTFRPGRRRGALAQPANGLGGGLVGVVLTWQPGWALAQLRPCRCCECRWAPRGVYRQRGRGDVAHLADSAQRGLVPMVFPRHTIRGLVRLRLDPGACIRLERMPAAVHRGQRRNTVAHAADSP